MYRAHEYKIRGHELKNIFFYAALGFRTYYETYYETYPLACLLYDYISYYSVCFPLEC